MREITLQEVLDAREARAERQRRLLAQWGQPLLSCTLNIAGPVKRSALGDFLFRETLRALEGRVQIWLPDLKYADNALAERYSGAPDYFETACAAILEMHRQSGDCVLEDGLLRRGVVIRHLLLPGGLNNAKAVMDWVARTFRPGQVLFSLMSQYTPQPGAQGLLARRVTGAEYRAALAYMENLGIVDGYRQESSSAQREYTPDFDLSGI